MLYFGLLSLFFSIILINSSSSIQRSSISIQEYIYSNKGINLDLKYYFHYKTTAKTNHSRETVANHPNLRLLPKNCGLEWYDKMWRNPNETVVGWYTWLALLAYRKDDGTEKFLCGGSLINPYYVLTAASCVKNTAPYILSSVRLGEHDLTKDPDCYDEDDEEDLCKPARQDIGVQRIIIHPEYNPTTKHNNIALIRLEYPPDPLYLRFICLPITKEIVHKDYVYENLTVIGWGINSNPTNVKMQMDVTVMPNSNCRSHYSKSGREIIDTQMCALGNYTKGQFCRGEFGGPLMSIDNVERSERIGYYISGIYTYGPKECGSHGYPDVYTRVASFIKWILDHIEK